MREQRRLAAIVSADVAGYSRLMGRDESGTLAALKALRRDVVDPQIAAHGGRIVKTTGDGLLLEFPSVVDAVQCIVEMQTTMAAEIADVPEDRRIAFRIGVNLGDIIIDGDDIFGDGVNIAARLQELSGPGGMCMSGRVYDDVRDRLDLKFEDGGAQALKNIARPIHVWRWLPGTLSLSQEVAAGLVGTSISAPDKPSIAVLPFKNMGGDPEQEYFVDGLVEDITTALSRISSFFVIARNSAFTYKDRVVDVRQVGRELGVRYVLEGSVRKAGNQLRITGQLVDAGTGNHIWANRYDGALADIFHLQDSITSNVVAVIAPKVLQAEITRAQAKPTDSLTAYDLYLRALALVSEAKADLNVQALTLLYRAIELDPNYSSAYGLIANVHWNRLILDLVPLGEANARGLEAARRAIETGRDNPDALARGGLGIALLGGRPEEGLPHLERALALNPNSLLVTRNAGVVFGMVGDHARGLALYERTMQLNPLDPWVFDTYFHIALLHFFAGRLEETLGWINKALGEKPEFGPALCLKAAALASADRPRNEVQEVVQRLLTNAPGVSIKVVRERMLGWRQVDGEAFSVGMRKAGFPE
jgi:TolB-like protein/class 3 adenylate cyclase